MVTEAEEKELQTVDEQLERAHHAAEGLQRSFLTDLIRIEQQEAADTCRRRDPPPMIVFAK